MKENQPKYKVSLETSGEIFKSKGETIEEAMSTLGIGWENVKAKGVITVKEGKKAYSHLFYIKQLRRIFANKLTLLMWAKRLKLLLESS